MNDIRLPEQFYVDVGSVNLSFAHGTVQDQQCTALRSLTLSGRCFQLAKYAESPDEIFGARVDIREAEQSPRSDFRIMSYPSENEPKLEAVLELNAADFQKLLDIPMSATNLRFSINIEYSDDRSLTALSKIEPMRIPILGFNIRGGSF